MRIVERIARQLVRTLAPGDADAVRLEAQRAQEEIDRLRAAARDAVERADRANEEGRRSQP